MDQLDQMDECRNRSKSTAHDCLSSNDSVVCGDKERNNSGSSRQPQHPSHRDSLFSANIESIESAHSSPNRGKKLKKIQTLWYAIKRFSPVHRVKSACNKRKLAEKTQRLYASHPDISYNNLVVLSQLETKRSQDDTDVLTNKSIQIHRPKANNYFDMNSFDNQFNTNIKQIDSLETDNELALNRQRVALLRQHPFYHLEVHLVCATNLLAKDICGTSDPYIKFKVGNKIVYKSRIVPKCLDPKWDEHFIIPIEDVFQPIQIRAYDHDFGFQDDFLGAANIDLTKLDISVPIDLELNLTETGIESESTAQTWGQLFLTVNLKPKTQEEKEMHFNRGFKTANIASGAETSVKKMKTQLWDSVVNIVLVEGKDLIFKDDTSNDIHIRFKLGSEKYKSRNIPKISNPIWSEQFDFHTYPDQSKVLEISLFGRDEIGKCSLYLNDLAKEETHEIWTKIDNIGSLLLLISISGTLGSETVSDLNAYEENSEHKNSLINKYRLLRTFNDIDDIGVLIVKVFRAEALAAADIGGKSDPFCVLELVNTRLQTNTEYKTLSPEWNKIYSFNVKDIHSVLEITVFDEDRDKKVEFLGKVVIPLLKINNGEKKWYTLKDKKLLSRAKGQILLEMSVFYNKIKASIRTFNPRETKFIKPEQRFKRTVFIRNVSRLKTLIMEIVEIVKFMNSCFQWDSVPRSIISLTMFLLLTYFFELYMAPIVILLLFIKNYIWITVENYFNPTHKEEEIGDLSDSFDDEDDDTKNEEKKSLKEKLQTVQEIIAIIQNVVGEIASTGERIKNTLNFSVPFLSWLAIICLSIITIILYWIPLRYLIMVWGINKFTKKLRSPNAINNNELLDFLSRVPDMDEKIMYKEYKVHTNNPITTTEVDRKKKKKL